MNIIEQLITNNYALYNVSEKKAPVNRYGRGMGNWMGMTNEELKQEHNYQSNLWGMRMGKQENGKYIMSLDFDVCGQKDKNTGERTGCEFTKQKLEQYKQRIDRPDGCFSSSTAGNWNVLVDYTNSPRIIELISANGTNKKKVGELEILLGGNQVIPPSQTICKISHAIGNARTFMNNQIFYELSADSEPCFLTDFIADLLTPEKMVKCVAPEPVNKPILKIINPVKTKNDSKTQQYSDKYLELLFEVIKNEYDAQNHKIISRDIWFKICGIMKFNNYDKQEWLKYSGFVSQSNTASKTWEAIKNKTPMSIYGLQNIAKEINPEKYKQWLIKHQQYIKLKTLEGGENDVARYLSEPLKDLVKYCKDDWYIADSQTNLWRRVKRPDSIIVSHLQRDIDVARETLLSVKNGIADEDERKKLKDIEKKYISFYSAVGRSGFIKQTITYLSNYLHAPDFLDQLDNTPYKIVFQNGVLDLTTLQFTEGIKREYYISKTAPFDWREPTTEEYNFVREQLKKINNYNEAHLDCYLSNLGYAMTGDSNKEQLFNYLRGQTAENGKSMPFEALEIILPNYVQKATSNILDKGADLKKEVPTWRGLRILWLNEVSTKEKDPDVVKALCDGTDYKYNRNYAIEAEKVRILFKLFAVSNNSMSVKGDAGFVRRFKLYQYNSQFKEEFTVDNFDTLQFKRDKTLSDKLTGVYKFAFLKLIFEHSKAYFEEKCLRPHPAEWMDEAADNMEDNDGFKVWFDENIIVDNAGSLAKAEFTERLPNKLQYVKIKDELTRLKIPFSYDSQKRENGKKGFYCGFRFRTGAEKGEREEREAEAEYKDF